MSQPIALYDLEADAEWPSGIDPAEWRRLPDPDDSEIDDDEDEPAQQYLIDLIGYDPDDLFPNG